MRCGSRLVSSAVLWGMMIATLSAQSPGSLGEAPFGAPTEGQVASFSPQPNGVSPLVEPSPTSDGPNTIAQTKLGEFDSQPSGCWKLTGGASLYYLKPYAEGNTAYQTTTITTGSTGNTATVFGQTTNQDFDWNMKPAGACWLGVTNPSGFGIRARNFFFDGTSADALVSLTPGQASTPFGQVPSVTNVINPSPFVPQNFPGALPPVVAGSQSFSSPAQLLNVGVGQDDLLFRSSLKIDAVDIEPNFAWSAGNWSFLAGAGVRYLQIAQTYQAGLQNLGGGAPASEFETLNLSNKFWGVGPTISGEFTWTFRGTGLALFASGRGSLLVGSANRLAVMTEVLNDPTGLTANGIPTFIQRESRIPNRTDVVLPVAELELGLEYGLDLGNKRLYFRGAVVDQTYFDAGNASRTTGNLGLFGCQVSSGLNF